MQQILRFDGRDVHILLPECPSSVLWLHSDPEEPRAMAALLPRTAVFCVSGVDWNADLSPWPAPACFRGGAAFAGLGQEHLRWLLQRALPLSEKETACFGLPRFIAGYSLSGLFALWALLESDAFAGAASASGSLWFDGFGAYLERHALAAAGKRVALSLGDREAATKNARLRTVMDATLAARDTLRAAGANVAFETNPGGHFTDPEKRLRKAVAQLLSMA